MPHGLSEADKQKYIEAKMKESNSLFHFAFDRPYTANSNVYTATSTPLAEWDLQTRRRVIENTHAAYERNPLANAVVRLTTLFSVGQGFTISYSNDRVEEVLEEFRNNPENAIQEYEKLFCDDLQIDGELFIRFHKGEDGETVVQPYKPWEVEYITHEKGFPKRITGYFTRRYVDDGSPGGVEQLEETVPADEMIHVSINKASYELRGRPDLFRLLPWLKAYKDWLENRARQNQYRDALLWKVTLEGASPQQVAAKRAQYRQPPSPGSLVVSNEKETWEPLQNTSSAGQVAEDGRQIKLMAAVGAALPEYMLSDGQNANLASATAQQLPALRKFTDYQDILVNQVWIPIYKRVIENAIEAGRLPEKVMEIDSEGEPVIDGEMPTSKPTPAPALATDKPEPKDEKATKEEKPKARQMIKAVDAFTLKAPELESADPKNLADALLIANNAGWVSNETAASELGYDYRLEQKRIERERTQKIDQAKELGLQPAVGQMGNTTFQAPPPPEEQAKARESLSENGDGMLSIKLPAPQVINNIDATPIAEAAMQAMTNVLGNVTVNIQNDIDTSPIADVLGTMHTQAPQITVMPVPQLEPPEPTTERIEIKRDKDGNISGLIKHKE